MATARLNPSLIYGGNAAQILFTWNKIGKLTGGRTNSFDCSRENGWSPRNKGRTVEANLNSLISWQLLSIHRFTKLYCPDSRCFKCHPKYDRRPPRREVYSNWVRLPIFGRNFLTPLKSEENEKLFPVSLADSRFKFFVKLIRLVPSPISGFPGSEYKRAEIHLSVRMRMKTGIQSGPSCFAIPGPCSIRKTLCHELLGKRECKGHGG